MSQTLHATIQKASTGWFDKVKRQVNNRFGESFQNAKEIIALTAFAAIVATLVYICWTADKPMLGRHEMKPKHHALHADNRIVGGARKALPYNRNQGTQRNYPMVSERHLHRSAPLAPTPATIAEMTANGCYHQQYAVPDGTRVKTVANR